MSVDIIITTYNAAKIISACLKSVKAQTYTDWTCYVIDDASTDGTVALIRKDFSWVKLLVREKNSGPSINRNIAIDAGNGEMIAVLDSDVVLDKHWLREQVTFMDAHLDCGIVGSKLVYYDNPKKLNARAGGLYTFGIGFDDGRGKPVSTFKKPLQCIYACSAALLMRREIVATIGGFDETYFYGHEDTDLGWRANIAGYSVWSNPLALAKHRVSETMKNFSWRIYYHARKNYIRSVIKNYSWWNVLWALPMLVTFLLADLCVKGPRWAKLKGILWNIWHLPSTLIMRYKVQKTRKVSDLKLRRLFTKLSFEALFKRG